MTTLYDVPADALIETVAERLAEEDTVEEPGWARFAKTATNRELPPIQEDFWITRAASVLRKVAINGPVGVGQLRTEYGGAKQGSTRYQVRPRHKTKGSGKIIRTVIVQLEEAGYVEQAGAEGRQVTPEGRSFLDETAGDVLADLDRPDLERYA